MKEQWTFNMISNFDIDKEVPSIYYTISMVMIVDCSDFRLIIFLPYVFLAFLPSVILGF